MSGFRLDLTFRQDDEAHIAVAGRVGSVEAGQIATLVQALLAVGARQLIVDLDHVGQCDPALIAFLERQRRLIATAGGWIIVVGAPSTPGDDASSLVEIFEIYSHVRGLSDPHGPVAIDSA